MSPLNQTFHDPRLNQRIRENQKIYWRIPVTKERGIGQIRNISSSGMLMETTSQFNPLRDCLFAFDTELGHDNYIPQTGRLVWFKPKDATSDRYICGIEFVQPAEYVMTRLRKKIQARLLTLTKVEKLKAASGGIFVVLLTVVLGYILWFCGSIYQDMNKTSDNLLASTNQQATLVQSYAHRYDSARMIMLSINNELNSTKELYRDSENVLKGVSNELAVTQAILSETEKWVGQVKNIAADAPIKLETLSGSSNDQLTQLVSSLQGKNSALTKEIARLNDQIKKYEGNIKTVAEGKEAIKFYKGRLKEIENKIAKFQRETKSVRNIATRQKDRIRLDLGNNGFIVKQGSVVKVDNAQFDSVNLDSLKDLESKSPQPFNNDVKINVDIVE